MMPMLVLLIMGRAHVFHLVDAAALGAALDGALLGHAEPEHVVRVGGEAGAAGELLGAEGFDCYGVVEGS